MKIAMFHELPFGGARRVVEEYGKRLKREHIIDIYFVDEHADKKAPSFCHKSYFYSFLEKKWEGRDWKCRLYKDSWELLCLYMLHRKIADDINRESYDCVFVHPSKFTQTPFLSRFLKHPSIYFCQEPLRIVYDDVVANVSNIPLPNKLYEKIVRAIRKSIDRGSIHKIDYILANSFFSKDTIKRAYGRESIVCYLGVDTQTFKPLRIEKKYDILFVGEKNVVEGYDFLVECMQFFKMPPVVRVLSRTKTGSGIPDSELIREYNKAKVVVALSRNEPFGLVPLEAMACGIPVVAIAEGGLRESVIDGTTGFLVQRNQQALYALEKLLGDERLRLQLGRQAREYVKRKWTWEKSYKTIRSILNQCAKET